MGTFLERESFVNDEIFMRLFFCALKLSLSIVHRIGTA